MKLSVNVRQLQALVKRLGDAYVRSKKGRHTLASKIADELKEIAENRVEHTKTAPDGTTWDPWSSSYAATRGGQHSLLVDTRELLTSFDASASAAGNVVTLRNDAPHAGYVQAKRPFLGIGRLEQEASEDLALNWLGRLL
jgi:hypothetical protein